MHWSYFTFISDNQYRFLYSNFISNDTIIIKGVNLRLAGDNSIFERMVLWFYTIYKAPIWYLMTPPYLLWFNMNYKVIIWYLIIPLNLLQLNIIYITIIQNFMPINLLQFHMNHIEMIWWLMILCYNMIQHDTIYMANNSIWTCNNLTWIIR